MTGPATLLRGAAALALIFIVAFVTVEVQTTAATAGFAFLIAILLVAIWTNLTISMIASVVAALVYNYFFFAPLHTLRIHETEDWIALLSFLAASLITTRLVVRARRHAEENDSRRREIEALYALSIDLFQATNRSDSLDEAARRALANVGAASGGLVLFGSGPYEQRVISWSDPRDDSLEDVIAGVGRHNAPVELPAPTGRDVFLPLNLGGHTVGVFVARRTTARLRALESAATLVALAVERERFFAESAHIRALKEGDALKTSLLRAVSHDLVTPLTAIALQVDRLRSLVDGRAAEVVGEIAENTGRLRRRIENLLAMARLEARSVVPHPEPTPAADLFRSVCQHLPLVAQNRRIQIRVATDTPDVYVDPSLALEILANLIENAHQAAPSQTTIELSAFRHPERAQRVRLEIADHGPGLRDIGDPSDTPRRGLGLDIARSLATASGGTVTLANRNGGGAIAHVDLPAAELPVVEEISH